MLPLAVADRYCSLPPDGETDGDQTSGFLPFAKKSRTVRRGLQTEFSASSLFPTCPCIPQSTTENKTEFWDRIGDLPSSSWTEEYQGAPAALVGSSAVHRTHPVLERHAHTRQQEAGRERLPAPSELYKRRRRGSGCRSASSDRRMVAVLRHIEDLKKRQSVIDELKKEKWGGTPSICYPEGISGPGERELGETEDPGLAQPSRELGTTASQQFNDTLFSPTPSLSNQQLLLGRGLEELSLAPGQDPMMSFVMATTDRKTGRAGFLTTPSPKEFWGFSCSAEE